MVNCPIHAIRPRAGSTLSLAQMPILFPDNKILYIDCDDGLREIFGHRDFDGIKVKSGDWILFENGKVARIKNVAGEEYHEWEELYFPNQEAIENIKEMIAARNSGIDTARSLTEIYVDIKENNRKRFWIFSVISIALLLIIIGLIILSMIKM